MYSHVKCHWFIQYFFENFFLNQIYVVDTQKNRHHETVLLSTQNKCFNIFTIFMFKICGLSGPMKLIKLPHRLECLVQTEHCIQLDNILTLLSVSSSVEAVKC